MIENYCGASFSLRGPSGPLRVQGRDDRAATGGSGVPPVFQRSGQPPKASSEAAVCSVEGPVEQRFTAPFGRGSQGSVETPAAGMRAEARNLWRSVHCGGTQGHQRFEACTPGAPQA